MPNKVLFFKIICLCVHSGPTKLLCPWGYCVCENRVPMNVLCQIRYCFWKYFAYEYTAPVKLECLWRYCACEDTLPLKIWAYDTVPKKILCLRHWAKDTAPVTILQHNGSLALPGVTKHKLRKKQASAKFCTTPDSCLVQSNFHNPTVHGRKLIQKRNRKIKFQWKIQGLEHHWWHSDKKTGRTTEGSWISSWLRHNVYFASKRPRPTHPCIRKTSTTCHLR